MTYGDGFLEDATSQAQNNLSGMLGLAGASRARRSQLPKP
jgi:hypothetical protein